MASALAGACCMRRQALLGVDGEDDLLAALVDGRLVVAEESTACECRGSYLGTTRGTRGVLMRFCGRESRGIGRVARTRDGTATIIRR